MQRSLPHLIPEYSGRGAKVHSIITAAPVQLRTKKVGCPFQVKRTTSAEMTISDPRACSADPRKSRRC